MQSILVLSKNKTEGEQYIQNLLHEFSINTFDVSNIEGETTIGIEEVRHIQKNLLLKPTAGKSKAIIFKNADSLTLQAQNALLKILEEPPNHTIIILHALSKEQLLPTILSRCKIIELKNQQSEISDKEYTQYLNILISLLAEDIGLRLKIAQDISGTKESSIPWVETMTLVIRKELLDSLIFPPATQASLLALRAGQYLNILIFLSKTHTTLLTTNINPRFAIEHLFLHF